MKDFDLHDCYIIAYGVDLELKELTLSINAKNYIEVIFSGYLSHKFENISDQNIISQVKEITISQFIDAEKENLQEWITFELANVLAKNENELSEKLSANNYKIYKIQSSSGLDGYVFAKEMIITRTKPTMCYGLDKPRIYVDFNELVSFDEVLLSQTDYTNNSKGKRILLKEGMQIAIYQDDLDAADNLDSLLADGVVVYNNSTSKTKWNCKIDNKGIYNMSDLKNK